MKKWVENKELYGAVFHTLVFGHHGEDPEAIVALFRDSEGDWFTTSNVLDTSVLVDVFIPLVQMQSRGKRETKNHFHGARK